MHRVATKENGDVMTKTVYRHLALLDERTAVKPDDYEKAEVKRDGGRAMAEQCYMLSTRHASNHKWFYFPSMEMQKDVILIKQMESDWTKSGRRSFRMHVEVMFGVIPMASRVISRSFRMHFEVMFEQTRDH